MKKNEWMIRGKVMFFILLAAVMLFPVFYTFTNSFMGKEEIMSAYQGIVSRGKNAQLHLLPDKITVQAYGEVFFNTPEYLVKFWKSIGMCTIITLGQVLIGGMCGMAFAKYHFRGWKIFFVLYILFLLLPIQVTLLPNYIVLSALHLTGTWWALILPGIFAPFGIFWMTLIFQRVPTEILEAAKLDGAGTPRIFWNIMFPVAKPGVVSLMILVFVDSWNMVEQPMVFLEHTGQFPLSVFLASVNSENFALQFVCGILSLIPVTLLFLFFNEELSEGISIAVSK